VASEFLDKVLGLDCVDGARTLGMGVAQNGSVVVSNTAEKVETEDESEISIPQQEQETKKAATSLSGVDFGMVRQSYIESILQIDKTAVQASLQELFSLLKGDKKNGKALEKELRAW